MLLLLLLWQDCQPRAAVRKRGQNIRPMVNGRAHSAKHLQTCIELPAVLYKYHRNGTALHRDCQHVQVLRLVIDAFNMQHGRTCLLSNPSRSVITQQISSVQGLWPWLTLQGPDGVMFVVSKVLMRYC